MEPIEGSETSAYIYQTLGNYPKENLLYSEHCKSLKSRILHLYGEETARPLKMEPIEGSETSAYIYQMPGNYPKENLLYSEHGESLKSRILHKVAYQNAETEK
jgi:hypothetical protein